MTTKSTNGQQLLTKVLSKQWTLKSVDLTSGYSEVVRFNLSQIRAMMFKVDTETGEIINLWLELDFLNDRNNKKYFFRIDANMNLTDVVDDIREGLLIRTKYGQTYKFRDVPPQDKIILDNSKVKNTRNKKYQLVHVNLKNGKKEKINFSIHNLGRSYSCRIDTMTGYTKFLWIDIIEPSNVKAIGYQFRDEPNPHIHAVFEGLLDDSRNLSKLNYKQTSIQTR